MAAFEKDEVPMLSDTHPQSFNEDSQFERFGRTQSAILMNSMESFSSETNLVGHTGPLRSQRTPFVPMSGPLFVNRQPNNILRPTHSGARKREAEASTEKFPATNVTIQNDWPVYSYAGKNEHLLRSGQLGMCNDPYCTTCPTHYHFKGSAQRQSKVSSIFDTQVCSFLNLVTLVFLDYHSYLLLYTWEFILLVGSVS